MSSNVEKQISNLILRTVLVSLFSIVIKIVQISVYHDKVTGLIKTTPMSIFLQTIVVLCVLYIVFECLRVTFKVKKIVANVKVNTKPIIGLTTIMVGICFLFQGIMDTLTGFTTKNVKAMFLIVGVLGIATAIDFFIQGFSMVSGNFKSNFTLNIIPVLWGIAVLMNVLITYPVVVSIQPNISKVLCSCLLLLFLYFICKWNCGYEEKTNFLVSVFIKLSYFSLSIIFILPYCIVYLFGVRDDIINVPYIALLGLALYGFIILMQYMAVVLNKVQKRIK